MSKGTCSCQRRTIDVGRVQLRDPPSPCKGSAGLEDSTRPTASEIVSCKRPRSTSGPRSSARSPGSVGAKFIVEGFLAGLHASPFHGFSVEFTEHRKYVPGDDLKDLDWNVYAKTDKYYVKKFQAETNITGYLVMDLSASMGYTYRQELTKFEYAICLAAALGYLMIHQQDPVGLVTFDTQDPDQPAAARASGRSSAPSCRVLANLKPAGADRRRRLPAPARGDDPQQEPGHALQRPADRPGAGARRACTTCGTAATRSSCSTSSTRPRCTSRSRALIEFEDVEDARQADARRPGHARRLPAGAGGVPASCYQRGVRQGEHRLRADGHERQLRQGADGVSAAAAATVLSAASA